MSVFIRVINGFVFICLLLLWTRYYHSSSSVFTSDSFPVSTPRPPSLSVVSSDSSSVPSLSGVWSMPVGGGRAPSLLDTSVFPLLVGTSSLSGDLSDSLRCINVFLVSLCGTSSGLPPARRRRYCLKLRNPRVVMDVFIRLNIVLLHEVLEFFLGHEGIIS